LGSKIVYIQINKDFDFKDNVSLQKKLPDNIKELSSEVWVSPSAVLGFKIDMSLPNFAFTKGLS